jgi:hypothetical protein
MSRSGVIMINTAVLSTGRDSDRTFRHRTLSRIGFAAAALAALALGGCAEPPKPQEAAFVRAPRPLVPTPPKACAASTEMAALQSRVLLSDLMVSALSCNEQPRYNAFVTKYKTDIGKEGATLQAFFQKAYGGAGRTQMNRFVTDLANNSSNYSLEHIGLYCQETGKTFDALLASNPSSLATYAAQQPYANIHGVAPCKK